VGRRGTTSVRAQRSSTGTCTGRGAPIPAARRSVASSPRNHRISAAAAPSRKRPGPTGGRCDVDLRVCGVHQAGQPELPTCATFLARLRPSPRTRIRTGSTRQAPLTRSRALARGGAPLAAGHLKSKPRVSNHAGPTGRVGRPVLLPDDGAHRGARSLAAAASWRPQPSPRVWVRGRLRVSLGATFQHSFYRMVGIAASPYRSQPHGAKRRGGGWGRPVAWQKNKGTKPVRNQRKEEAPVIRPAASLTGAHGTFTIPRVLPPCRTRGERLAGPSIAKYWLRGPHGLVSGRGHTMRLDHGSGPRRPGPARPSCAGPAGLRPRLPPTTMRATIAEER